MKKILFILPSDQLGGSERVAQNLAYHIADTNPKYSIIIYFLKRKKSTSWKKSNNISLVYGDARRERSALYGLIKFIYHQHNIDYTYTTHSHINAAACLLRKLKILKTNRLILRESTVFSDRFFGLKGAIFRSLYLFYGTQDLLICQTHYMKKRLLEEVELSNKENIVVIQNPLSLQLIRKKVQQDCCLSSKTFNIIMTGRLAEIKNHTLLIRALYTINKWGFSNFKLTVLGDGPLKQTISKAITYYKLYDKIDIVGRTDNPYKYMAKADLGIITSIKEGFPNVIIEMMASGTKDIITTPCAGELDSLPAVTITNGYCYKELSSIIKGKILQPLDNTSIYYRYASNRNIDKFWQRITQNL